MTDHQAFLRRRAKALDLNELSTLAERMRDGYETNLNRFCSAVNEIAKVMGHADKQCYAPDAVVRWVDRLQAIVDQLPRVQAGYLWLERLAEDNAGITIRINSDDGEIEISEADRPYSLYRHINLQDLCVYEATEALKKVGEKPDEVA